MKVSDNFDIREFVPPYIWETFGNSSVWFIRPEIVNFAQFIRDRYNKPVTCNNWHYSPGGYSERGFRLPNTSTGGKLSQHKFGNALDFTVQGITPDEIRLDIIDNWHRFSNYITTLEHSKYAHTWVHVDNRTTNKDEPLIVKP